MQSDNSNILKQKSREGQVLMSEDNSKRENSQSDLYELHNKEETSNEQTGGDGFRYAT
jgi:hypothetical protein